MCCQLAIPKMVVWESYGLAYWSLPSLTLHLLRAFWRTHHASTEKNCQYVDIETRALTTLPHKHPSSPPPPPSISLFAYPFEESLPPRLQWSQRIFWVLDKDFGRRKLLSMDAFETREKIKELLPLAIALNCKIQREKSPDGCTNFQSSNFYTIWYE